MKDFRFGTLVFVPAGEALKVGNELRSQYDPISAKKLVLRISHHLRSDNLTPS
jgi:hypothetical protein